tara:strand:- start:361 stop:543 length:183 start_codon:yes stop_codon:yes gene_type:complete
MFEMIDFQDKKWRVVGKIRGDRIDDHTKLKENYGCDLVLKNNQNMYFILDEIIDVEFEDI